MSTNLRKAQKHMQRATELLNQSQLGFGKQMKKSRDLYEFGGLQETDLQSKQRMLDNLTCEEIVRTSKVNKDFKSAADKKHLQWCKENNNMSIAEVDELLSQKNSPEYMRKHAEKQMKNNKVRLRSLPPEKLHEVCDREERIEVNKQMRKIIKQLNYAPRFDITLNIQSARYYPEDNTYLLRCTLDKDNNKNFEHVLKSKTSEWSNSNVMRVDVVNADSEKEYWRINHWYKFICSADLKWAEMKKILQMHNEKKEKDDPTRVRFS